MAATTANPRPHSTVGYANVAANLANTNRKVIDPQPPKHEKFIPHFHAPGRSKSLHSPQGQPQSSPISLASSKAALLAHQGQAATPAGPSPSKSNAALETRAAATAARSSNIPHTARPRRPASSDGPNSIQSNHGLGDRAAAAATKSWSTPSAAPAQSNTVYGHRGEHATPAVSKAWREQKLAAHRPVVAPLSEKEAAIIQRRIESRQQESSDRRERQPIIRMKPEYLGEHPPVRLEREEKAHAADLHEQAVHLAKQAYARQQQQQGQKTAAQQTTTDRSRRNDRADLEELDMLRHYYGTPAPVQQSKSQRLLKRSKSQQSRPRDVDDVAQSQRIRAQMNKMRSQIDQIDASKQEQDRKRLLEAARNKVQSDMLKMDELVYKDTGKMSKAMMDDWDFKGREKSKGQRQQAAFQGLQPDRAVNIGGDRLIDQSDIDQLAASRVKPTLAGIDEAVQKKRDLDDKKREEKEERQREREIEREEKAELKREKVEERRKLKEQKAAEKTEAGEGDVKRLSLTERLPALAHFGRHKRNGIEQEAGDAEELQDQSEGEAAVEREAATTDNNKSPLRLPIFNKFSRHRRNESAETGSDDDDDDDNLASGHGSPVGEKRSSRRMPIFGKLGRSHHSPTVEQARQESVEDDAHQQQQQQQQLQSESPTRASKSIKSRLSKLVHRREQPDEPAKGKSFEHTNGSVGTLTRRNRDPASASVAANHGEDADGASVTDDDSLRPRTSGPIPIEGGGSLERQISADDRDDRLFGQHLPSKFRENM